MDEAAAVRANLERVRERIGAACRRAGRDPNSVTLVAVGKTRPAATLRHAFEAGQIDFGENYVQELLAKQSALPDGPRWHFIGGLQTNKARQVVGRVALLHSLDRLPLAVELDRRAREAGRTLDVLLEVNLGAEAGKWGVAIGDLPGLARDVARLPGLRLRGLMCIPPPGDDPGLARAWFGRCATLRGRLQDELGLPLPELSMGMSADLEQAVEEGATLVRVGSDIFGRRG